MMCIMSASLFHNVLYVFFIVQPRNTTNNLQTDHGREGNTWRARLHTRQLFAKHCSRFGKDVTARWVGCVVTVDDVI